VALRRVIGFWPAAVLSSAMWAFTHTQYQRAGPEIAPVRDANRKENQSLAGKRKPDPLPPI